MQTPSENRGLQEAEWEAIVFSLSAAPVLSLQMCGKRLRQEAENQKEKEQEQGLTF